MTTKRNTTSKKKSPGKKKTAANNVMLKAKQLRNTEGYKTMKWQDLVKTAAKMIKNK